MAHCYYVQTLWFFQIYMDCNSTPSNRSINTLVQNWRKCMDYSVWVLMDLWDDSMHIVLHHGIRTAKPKSLFRIVTWRFRSLTKRFIKMGPTASCSDKLRTWNRCMIFNYSVNIDKKNGITLNKNSQLTGIGQQLIEQTRWGLQVALILLLTLAGCI